MGTCTVAERWRSGLTWLFERLDTTAECQPSWNPIDMSSACWNQDRFNSKKENPEESVPVLVADVVASGRGAGTLWRRDADAAACPAAAMASGEGRFDIKSDAMKMGRVPPDIMIPPLGGMPPLLLSACNALFPLPQFCILFTLFHEFYDVQISVKLATRSQLYLIFLH